MQSISFLSVVFLLLTISPLSQAQVVCSEDELIRELREDIEDNGKLDCLRVSLNPVDQDETEAQKARRIASQWVSDCSFEAENTGEGDWFQKLQQNYGLKKGLVDVNGNPVDRDFSDQADMCEIVRALIANGKIDGAGDDVTNLNVDILDNINCVGGDGQTKVCAATAGSFANKKMWYILLDGSVMQFGSKPKFTVSADSK